MRYGDLLNAQLHNIQLLDIRWQRELSLTKKDLTNLAELEAQVMHGLANAMGKLSHKTTWATPVKVYEDLCMYAGFNPTIDCCATIHNTKCEKFITPEQDFFKTEVTEDAFINPPYIKSSPRNNVRGIDQFIARLYYQHLIYNFNAIILLFTTTSSSGWFQQYFGSRLVNYYGEKSEVIFYPERIQFIGSKGKSPPMSSFALVWQRQKEGALQEIRGRYGSEYLSRGNK